MRSLMSVFLAAAVLAIGSVVFAAPQRGTADLTPLTVSGVTGQAKLNEVSGQTNFHLQIRGLEPGVEYRAQWYLNQSCAVEATVNIAETFVANPAGMANVNVKLDRTLQDFGSISVVLVSDLSVQACGAVVIE